MNTRIILNLLGAGILGAGILLTAGCTEKPTGQKSAEITASQKSAEITASQESAETTASQESPATSAGQETTTTSTGQEGQKTTTASASTITFTDDLGREVTVDRPQRVAALLGSYADIWYLAGGEICASADDAWEDFDLPLSGDAVNLGMTKELSLEKLLEADPDFVLASSNTKGNVEWMDTLEAAGITTAYFGVSDFEDYLRVLNYCTKITGREDLYQKNGLAIAEQIDQVVEESQNRIEETGKAPTVLSLRASSTFIRAKNSRDNVLGEMLKALGCINIADQDDSLLENLSIEHIVLQDPDFIFVVQQGDDPEGTKANMESFIADNPAWLKLTAVQEGRVFYMEKSLYSLKPNDRWGEAYEKLERILADGEKTN